jgi:hypothetical protein
MIVTAKVDMAVIMTGVDTGIMKTATVTGFMRRRQAFILRLQSRASGCFFRRSILIPEWQFAARRWQKQKKMMADMKAQDAELTSQVAKMNKAPKNESLSSVTVIGNALRLRKERM